jgi:hypothetical protein
MTPQEFIAKIRRVVCQSAITGTLAIIRKPPGRKPPENLTLLSQWFEKLSDADKKNLEKVVAIATHQSTFGLLAVIDGVRQIEDSPSKGTLELHYKKDGQNVLLNAPNSEYLHDLFNQEMPLI